MDNSVDPERDLVESVDEPDPEPDKTFITNLETEPVQEENENQLTAGYNKAEEDSNMQLVALESYSQEQQVIHLEDEYLNLDPDLSRRENSLKKIYKDRENALKDMYYKSNPLRKFISSTPGQSIMPQSKLSKAVYVNKKKGLPEIFSELRVNEVDQERVIENRELHKKGLRTTLKLNLKALEIDKNPIDTLEASKKIYTEYCRFNLTKPLDTSNVESIFKEDLKRFKARSRRLKKRNTPGLNSTMSSHLNNDSTSSEDSCTFKVGGRKCGDKELEINAHMVKLKGLNEMSKEIKQHKAYQAKNNFNNFNKIYPKCNEISTNTSTKRNFVVFNLTTTGF